MTLDSALVSVTHELENCEKIDADRLKSLAISLTTAATQTAPKASTVDQGPEQRWKTAERLLRRALALQEATLGPVDVQVSWVTFELI